MISRFCVRNRGVLELDTATLTRCDELLLLLDRESRLVEIAKHLLVNLHKRVDLRE